MDRKRLVFSDDFEEDDGGSPDLRDMTSWDVVGRTRSSSHVVSKKIRWSHDVSTNF